MSFYSTILIASPISTGQNEDHQVVTDSKVHFVLKNDELDLYGHL